MHVSIMVVWESKIFTSEREVKGKRAYAMTISDIVQFVCQIDLDYGWIFITSSKRRQKKNRRKKKKRMSWKDLKELSRYFNNSTNKSSTL